jgi:hypothetical protein
MGNRRRGYQGADAPRSGLLVDDGFYAARSAMKKLP